MRDLHFTPIHERAKASLNISRDEYALCNYVEVWSAHPDNPTPGWCNRNKQLIADWVGISKRGLEKMIKRLMQDQLLSKNGAGMLKITKKWFEAVNLEKLSENSEQSSHPSAAKTANKVRTNSEQSSHGKANKVRTNSKYNSKYSKIDDVDENAAASKISKKKKAEISETVSVGTDDWCSDCGPALKGAARFGAELREEVASNFDAWGKAFRNMGCAFEVSPARLQELVDDFETHRATNGQEYPSALEYRKHFKNFTARRDGQKRQSASAPSSGGPRYPARAGRSGVNDASISEPNEGDLRF